MDIYNLINSKDVRNYLQDIHYQFTTPEAAFIVYWCKHATLDKKMEAWQEIIKTMPDCSMEKRWNMMHIDSFHAFLEVYITLQKQDIENFCSGDGYIYRYELLDADGWNGDERFDFFFSDYVSCVANCRKEDLADKIRIFKCPYNQTELMMQICTDTILLNNNFEIMDINVFHNEKYHNDLKFAFKGMCFDFPTPFKRGDILVGYAGYEMDYADHEMDCDRPFVLSYISTSDMDAFGTHIVHEDGTLDHDAILIMSIDLEYYREPLYGMERQLQVVSCFEKGEVDALLLANCCSAIRIEEYAKKVNHRCIIHYKRKKEAMEQCGMLSANSKLN